MHLRLLLLLLLPLTTFSATAADTLIPAGASSIDITPDYPMRNGYPVMALALSGALSGERVQNNKGLA